jgi:hypothetical protein
MGFQLMDDEHWKARALAVVNSYRQDDPNGWAHYLAEAEELPGADDLIE